LAGELIRRGALERIMRRAAERQAGERDMGEGLTEADVLALGNDVGIPARYLRQALLEERTRSLVEERAGLLGWLVGPGRLSAQRVVSGEPAAVERALDSWMQQEELLQVKRRYPDHTSWEPKVGAFASIQRALGSGGRRFALARATEIAGQVTPLESGFCHVQLFAAVPNVRKQRLGIAALLVGMGGPASGVLLAMAGLGPFSYIPLPVFGPAALAALAPHSRHTARV